MGSEHVLNSNDPEFQTKLTELAKKLKATVCFEAIGGPITGQIMSCLPFSSKCIVYGCLSEQPISEVEALLLIGRNQRIEGFLLNLWLQEKSLWTMYGIITQVQKLMRNKTLQSEVAKRITLDEVESAIPEYQKNMTLGKYVFYL